MCSHKIRIECFVHWSMHAGPGCRDFDLPCYLSHQMLQGVLVYMHNRPYNPLWPFNGIIVKCILYIETRMLPQLINVTGVAIALYLQISSNATELCQDITPIYQPKIRINSELPLIWMVRSTKFKICSIYITYLCDMIKYKHSDMHVYSP